MSKPNYRFCHLEIRSDESQPGIRITQTQCWLPEKHKGQVIEVGTRLKLEGDDRWWTVKTVSIISQSPERVKERQRIARKYRSSTDV